MAKRKSQISGQATAPSKRQQQGAKQRKPAAVRAVEAGAKAAENLVKGLNPFD